MWKNCNKCDTSTNNHDQQQSYCECDITGHLDEL